MARGAGSLSSGTWLPVADPDRGDVSLYIEFTARHCRKFVAPGTAVTAPDLAYVPYIRATIPDLESTRSLCGYGLCRRSVSVQLFQLCLQLLAGCRRRTCCTSIFGSCRLAMAGRPSPLPRRI